MPVSKEAKQYRWDDLPQDHPLELLDRRRIIGEKAMLSRMFLRKGCHVPTHSHENEQFAMVVSGALRMGIGAEGTAERYEITLRDGEVLHLPANTPHGADAVVDTLVIDVFAPPSETTGVDQARD